MSFGKFRQAKDQINQMRELKAQADAMQKQLNAVVVEADAGHGAVKVSVNGQQKLLSVKISPEAIDPNKVQKLEEWIVKAVNEAVEKSQKEGAKQVASLTGGLKIPGLT